MRRMSWITVGRTGREARILTLFLIYFKDDALVFFFFFVFFLFCFLLNEQAHDKTNKMACATCGDSDQTSSRLIRIFAFQRKKARVLSYPLHGNEDWSAWENAQVDLNLRWTPMPFSRFCRSLAHICYTWFFTCVSIKENWYTSRETTLSIFVPFLKRVFSKKSLRSTY